MEPTTSFQHERNSLVCPPPGPSPPENLFEDSDSPPSTPSGSPSPSVSTLEFQDLWQPAESELPTATSPHIQPGQLWDPERPVTNWDGPEVGSNHATVESSASNPISPEVVPVKDRKRKISRAFEDRPSKTPATIQTIHHPKPSKYVTFSFSERHHKLSI